MAIEALTSDRRGFLSAGAAIAAAVPVAATVNIYGSGLRAQWDAAMRDYTAAKVAMNTQDGDEVVKRFIKAEAAILDTRTPDMKALHWKLERMRDISDDNVIEPKDFDPILADIVRLAAGGN